jgi:hypothetical protein
MPGLGIRYEELPQAVKDNLSPEQWRLAQREVIWEGERVSETGMYINLKNGQRYVVEESVPANGPLLPVYDLSGAHGKDDTQFHTRPPTAPDVH